MKGIRQTASLAACFILVFWVLSPSAFGQSAPDWQSPFCQEALRDASGDTPYPRTGFSYTYERVEGGDPIGLCEFVVRGGATIGGHRTFPTADYYFLLPSTSSPAKPAIPVLIWVIIGVLVLTVLALTFALWWVVRQKLRTSGVTGGPQPGGPHPGKK